MKNEPDASVERKEFAEILYDLVGQNFLVNQNTAIRHKFLTLILRQKFTACPSFQARFLEILQRKIKSTKEGYCKKCRSEWSESDTIYRQALGLKKSNKIACVDPHCVSAQQKSAIPPFASPKFDDFVREFNLTKDYRRFCKQLAGELELPDEVTTRPPKRETKLLPTEITPMGDFSQMYDYQASIGLKITEMLERYTPETSRALVVLPTGSGKTRLVVETLIDWINKGKKGKEKSKFILWIADRNELCQQALDTFADVFRHRGKKDSSLKLHPIYSNSPKNIRDLLYKYSIDSSGETIEEEIYDENGIIIASIQSLYKLSQNDDQGSLNEVGQYASIVVIDEAHHAVPSNKSYTQVLRALGFNFAVRKAKADIHKYKACLLGLTATPFRSEDQMGKSTKALLNRFGKKDRILWPPFSDHTKPGNMPPFAHLDVQSTAFQNESVKLYGEGSYDRDGKISEYHFTIQKLLTGSDAAKKSIVHDASGEDKNIEFVFKKPGRYKVQLIVKDDLGETSKNPSTADIEIYPRQKRDEKTNLDAMKKLYKHLINREILAKPHHYIIDYGRRIDLSENDRKQFELFHDIGKSTISKIGNDSFRNNQIIEKIKSLVHKESRAVNSSVRLLCGTFKIDLFHTGCAARHKVSINRPHNKPGRKKRDHT